MESSMGGNVVGRIWRDIIEARGAMPAHDAVRHGFASCNCCLIFEVE
jgi:hypothetical protein